MPSRKTRRGPQLVGAAREPMIALWAARTSRPSITRTSGSRSRPLRRRELRAPALARKNNRKPLKRRDWRPRIGWRRATLSRETPPVFGVANPQLAVHACSEDASPCITHKLPDCCAPKEAERRTQALFDSHPLNAQGLEMAQFMAGSYFPWRPFCFPRRPFRFPWRPFSFPWRPSSFPWRHSSSPWSSSSSLASPAWGSARPEKRSQLLEKVRFAPELRRRWAAGRSPPPQTDAVMPESRIGSRTLPARRL